MIVTDIGCTPTSKRVHLGDSGNLRQASMTALKHLKSLIQTHQTSSPPNQTQQHQTVDPQSETETARQESTAITPSNRETPDSNDVSEGTPSKSVEVAAPITLDELLRQVHQTPRLQHEATLARLAERKRLAIAIHSTLEAAEQVADFGRAGTELLNDASLDKVVATMIAQQENEASQTEAIECCYRSNTAFGAQSTTERRVDLNGGQAG